jgi:hypothetical protein
MTEAVIVISFFIIALSGVVYFREMYVRKIQTMRVARAATIQYALGGCQGTPGGAVAPDMRGITATNARRDESVPNSQDTSSGMGGSSEARSATSNIAGTSGFFLNPIANVGMSGKASVGSSTRATFRSTMATSSYASCPDQVKPHDRDFVEVLGYISGLFGM